MHTKTTTQRPRFATSSDAAEALATTRQHVSKLIRDGALHAVRLSDRGRWRIPVAEIERLARGETP